MDFWSRILGRAENRTARSVKLKGPGHFATHIVGETDYAENLAKICGGRRERGVEKIVTAELTHDDGNPLDNMAILICIAGRPAGLLNSFHARNFRERMKSNGYAGWTAICKAKIKGEWDQEEGGKGHFRVNLDLPPEYTQSMNTHTSSPLLTSQS